MRSFCDCAIEYAVLAFAAFLVFAACAEAPVAPVVAEEPIPESCIGLHERFEGDWSFDHHYRNRVYDIRLTLTPTEPCQFNYDYQVWLMESPVETETTPWRTYHTKGLFVAADVEHNGPITTLTFYRKELWLSQYFGEEAGYQTRDTPLLKGSAEVVLWDDTLSIWEYYFVRD